jgi:hypothetical protein
MEVYEMISSMIPNLPRRKRFLYNCIETLFYASTFPLSQRLMEPLWGNDPGPFDGNRYLISVGLGIILYPLARFS